MTPEVEKLIAGSIVRRNLMTQPGYAPYCLSCSTMERMSWNRGQFMCRHCKFVTQFPPEFVKVYTAYREEWSK